MKTREIIIEEDNNERLDSIYFILKAIEYDLHKYTIDEILSASLELNEL